MNKTGTGVVVVDLDGTLVLGNSFHEFLAHLWRLGGARTRLMMLWAVARRAVSRSPVCRQVMKHRMVGAFEGLSDARARRVVEATLDGCRRQLSSPVLDLINDRRAAGWQAVLATAAPEAYARPLASSFGFSGCIASPGLTSSAADEMFAERKAAAVSAWLDGHPGHGEVLVVTDHQDDLPLIRLADTYVLQATLDECSAIVERVGRSPMTVFDPVEEEAGGGLWLWFDDRPLGPLDPFEVTTILSKHRYAMLYTGEGRWTRVLPGDSLGAAVLRRTCPRTPSLQTRMTTTAKRRVVRDRLGIYH